MPSPLTVRNVHFDTGPDVPRHWHGGRKSVTSFFNNLSLFFPAGERFFIASVNAHRDCVKDPELGEAVRQFCAQEGCHTREHVRYNQMLREQGYPVAPMEKRVERLLARVSRTISPRRRLAVTCALEHFTAILAEFLLGDRRLLAGAHPVMAALWLWHAAEESEHKALAFDVYRAAGGGYFERVTTMIGATVIFWGKVLEQQVRLMAADGIAASLREWAALAKYLIFKPGGILRMVRPYLRYYLPGFHPSKIDNRALLEAWKAEYAASPAYRQSA